MTERLLEPLRRRLRRREHRPPMDPLERMHDDMDRLFGEYFRRPFLPQLSFEEGENGALIANLDMSETDDTVEVVVDVPGIEEKDIEVTLSDGALLIKGKRESEKEEKDKNYHRIERSYGKFQRRVPLPCDVKADKIDARLEKGILTVKLPKSEESKKADRKIKIKT